MSQQQISLAAYEPLAAAGWRLACMLRCPVGAASKLVATSMQDLVQAGSEEVNDVMLAPKHELPSHVLQQPTELFNLHHLPCPGGQPAQLQPEQ